MSITQRLPAFPFALTTLCLALAGCGGGSNNIAENPNGGGNSNPINECSATTASCVNLVFDDNPIVNLNYECGVYRGVTTITGTARCPVDSTVSFYLKTPDKDRKIVLGSFSVKSVRNTSASEAQDTSLIRVGAKELAENTTGRPINNLTDPAAQTAINISRLLQSLGRTSEPYISTAPVNRIFIDETLKASLLTSLTADILAKDFQDGSFEAKVKPWFDAQKRPLISAEEAKNRLLKTILAIKSGVFFANPISSLSVLDQLGINLDLGISGTGVVNSDQRVSNALFSLTNREGNTIGYGLQWVGTPKTPEELYTLFISKDFAKMRVDGLTGGINPFTNKLSNFKLKVSRANYEGESSSKYINVSDDGRSEQYNDTFGSGDTFSFINGKLVRDLMVIGTADVYKFYTGVAVADQSDLGTWDQVDSSNVKKYAGNASLTKTGTVNTYLDASVWATRDAVQVGKPYIFPLYVNLTFTNSDSYLAECNKQGLSCNKAETLKVVFLDNGDIVANAGIQADAIGQCTRTVTEDIPIGTVRAAYPSTDRRNFYINPSILLSGKAFGVLDGIQIGTSAVAPRVKLNLAGVLLAGAGNQGSINVTSSEPILDENKNVIVEPINNVDPAEWVNGYNTFIRSRVAAKLAEAEAEKPPVTPLPDVTNAQKRAAEQFTGLLSANTLSCNRVKVK